MSKEEKLLLVAYAGIALAYGVLFYIKFKHLKHGK
jgi:hypothetical protein